MWGDACCLAERGSKAPGSKYLPRKGFFANKGNLGQIIRADPTNADDRNHIILPNIFNMARKAGAKNGGNIMVVWKDLFTRMTNHEVGT